MALSRYFPLLPNRSFLSCFFKRNGRLSRIFIFLDLPLSTRCFTQKVGTKWGQRFGSAHAGLSMASAGRRHPGTRTSHTQARQQACPLFCHPLSEGRQAAGRVAGLGIAGHDPAQGPSGAGPASGSGAHRQWSHATPGTAAERDLRTSPGAMRGRAT